MRILINIDVPALGPAIKFYCEALGLVLKRTIDGDVAELIGASSAIYLLQKPAGSAVASAQADARHYNRHWTSVHIDFVVENLHEATKRAVAAGAVHESACVEWMGSKCVTFSDPFGNGFCLIEFLGESYSE